MGATQQFGGSHGAATASITMSRWASSTFSGPVRRSWVAGIVSFHSQATIRIELMQRHTPLYSFLCGRMPPSIPGCQLRGLWSAAWAYNYPLSQTRSGLTYDLQLFNLPWPESNRRHTHISGRLYHLSYKGILPGYSRLRARAVRRPMERDRFVILPAIAYYHSSFAPKCNFLKNI